MKRRAFLLGIASATTLVVSTGTAMAASYTEDVVAQLVKLGFVNITAETTLLGRVKIKAQRSDGVREIVINPRTGEILRDVWMPKDIGSAPRTVLNDIDDGDGNSGSGKDDDRDGDGGDDDNSGSDDRDDREDREDREDRDDRKGEDDD